MNIAAGILIVGNVSGMQNSVPPGLHNNIPVSNVGVPVNSANRNAENNEVFLPVRRFSEGMVNFSIWPEMENPGMRQDGRIIPAQQQNSQELIPQSSAGGPYMNRFYSGPRSPVPNIPNKYTGLITPEINGNTYENMMFLPILRNTDSVNQPNNISIGYSNMRENNVVNHLPQQQYNYLGYYPLSGIDNDILNPAFNYPKDFVFSEQQINIEKTRKKQELSSLEYQNEILKREIAHLKYQNETLRTEIAQRQSQIINLETQVVQQQNRIENVEKYVATQRDREEKLNRIVYLEQQNLDLAQKIERHRKENSQTKIAQLEDQVNKLKNKANELKNQIIEDNSRLKAEVNNLKEQLQKKDELNASLNTSTVFVLENKH